MQKDDSNLPRNVYAYNRLLNAIKEGELEPGTRLSEVSLGKTVGVSRSPRRAALSRLESEGLLTNDGNRGLIITRLDHNVVTELYEMRELLEGTAARLAARHASDIDMQI